MISYQNGNIVNLNCMYHDIHVVGRNKPIFNLTFPIWFENGKELINNSYELLSQNSHMTSIQIKLNNSGRATSEYDDYSCAVLLNDGYLERSNTIKVFQLSVSTGEPMVCIV